MKQANGYKFMLFMVCVLTCLAANTGCASPGGFKTIQAPGSKEIGDNPIVKQEPQPKTGGGPCEYKTYTGYAKITRVQPLEQPKGYPGPPYHPYDVRFRFHPDQPIEESHAQIEGKEQRLTLSNSWYPGPLFLKKYGIVDGKIFDCRMNVITHGTCTPIMFQFQEIDLEDYFERKVYPCKR